MRRGSPGVTRYSHAPGRRSCLPRQGPGSSMASSALNRRPFRSCAPAHTSGSRVLDGLQRREVDVVGDVGLPFPPGTGDPAVGLHSPAPVPLHEGTNQVHPLPIPSFTPTPSGFRGPRLSTRATLPPQTKVVSRILCKKAKLSEETGRRGKKRGSSLELFIAK